MKIAVVGRGTAGCMAAVQMTRELPDAELLHVFDSRTPLIGVGEGTTPNVWTWLHDVTGLGLDALRERCAATVKHGTRFEGWGREGQDFLHHFQPVWFRAYHFDAHLLAQTLAGYARAEVVDARVSAVERAGAGTGAIVRLEDGRALHCDYVLDARGFPPPGDPDVLTMDWIPTNAVTVARSPINRFSGSTRAIARPHGWVFAIPLEGYSSFGYLYNTGLSTRAEVEADFDELLRQEGVETRFRAQALSFPSFARRTFSDGAVFRIGNAASFVEPLEGASIGASLVQLGAATRWIRERAGAAGPPDPRELAAFNAAAFSYVCKNSLFIAWHYAGGSRYRTPFWAHAEGCLARAAAHPELAPFLADFAEFRAAGRACPIEDLRRIEDRAAWEREILPRLRLPRAFGNFSELNVALVGHGMGLFT